EQEVADDLDLTREQRDQLHGGTLGEHRLPRALRGRAVRLRGGGVGAGGEQGERGGSEQAVHADSSNRDATNLGEAKPLYRDRACQIEGHRLPPRTMLSPPCATRSSPQPSCSSPPAIPSIRTSRSTIPPTAAPSATPARRAARTSAT